MDLLKYTACRAIQEQEKELHELNSFIWNHPEVGKNEFKTCQALKKFLKSKNFNIIEFPEIPTGFLADFGQNEFGGGKRPNIGILCQFDAVPYRGHVTANNLMAEVAVGAALGLQEVFKASTAKLGKVTIIASPDSIRGGLIPFLNRKALRDVDAVLAAAPGSKTVWCPTYRGTKALRAQYRGHPGNQTNSIPPAGALTAAVYAQHNVLAVQQHFGRGWHVNGIISKGGRKASEMLTECETIVKLSANSNIDLELMEKRIVPCLEAAAKSTRCQLSLTLAQKCLYSMVSNINMTYCLQLNAYHCGVLSTPQKSVEVLGPVDVGNLSRQKPTIRPIFYIGTTSKCGTEDFKNAAATVEAHNYAIAMAKAIALTAVDLLHTPGTLARVKEEHKSAILKEKDIKFDPFPSSEPPGPLSIVATPLPPDSNTGWSKWP